MKHSKQYSTIRRRPLNNWYKRHRRFLMICAVVVVVALIMVLAITWQARADSIDYQQVHKCIETYKAINQDKVKPLYDVAQCTHNPNTIT
jgi:hypothetical protein